MRATILALPLLLLPLASVATEGDTQTLVNELRTLSDKARQQRAADRWLQRALDDLVARYDWPWKKELVFDDFADGDYQHQPAWQVDSGRFWVARGRGLRSRTEPGTAAAPATQPGSVEDAVIGALLQRALGTGEGNGAGTPAAAAINAIRLDTAISNAFALEADFSLEAPDGDGRFAFSLLQAGGQYGYRLRVVGGAKGQVELERVRGGRGAVVEQAPLATNPADGGDHRLSWRQAPDGEVIVELDGERLFAVRDKAFRDGYRQLGLSLAAGDLTLHSIRVSGTD